MTTLNDTASQLITCVLKNSVLRNSKYIFVIPKHNYYKTLNYIICISYDVVYEKKKCRTIEREQEEFVGQLLNFVIIARSLVSLNHS